MADDPDDTLEQPAQVADSATRFQPGQTGNAGGRPKGARRIAREVGDSIEYTGTDGKPYSGPAAAMRVLGEMMTDRDAKHRDRREAAKDFLDRIWGKPPQRVDLAEAPSATIDFDALTDEELDAEIARLEREDAEGRRSTTPNADVARSED